MPRPAIWLSIGLAGLVIAGFSGEKKRQSPAGTAAEMAKAAQTFLELLDDQRRAATVIVFEDEERFNWHYIPRERKGLPLKAMNSAQRKAAHALMRSALSSRGYLKATGVMQAERVQQIIENENPRRDPERYYFTVFGEPAPEKPWGWRLEGHHLSLNFTAVADEPVATTPAFMGASPHEVPSGHLEGFRVLGAEEDLARSLLSLLGETQLRQAVIAGEAPRDIITGSDREVRLQGFEGLPASEMTDLQLEMLHELIEQYIYNMKREDVHHQLERIRNAGMEKVHFAWAGGTEPGEGHYFRVHGPTLLIEYDNTQNNANHVHTVWRDLENDFGADLLREHYESSDHH